MDDIRFEELTYLSADGVTQIHAYIWEPVGIKPRGILQLSHGMCEFVQRYDAWARRFCAEGYVFCGNDHLGHGNSAPSPEALGHIPANGASLLVEDLHTLTRLMGERFPDLPPVLYGHSMGSFVARAYLSKYGKDLTAALISGTAGPGQPTALGRQVARLVGRMKGEKHRSKLLTALAFGSYNKHFADEKDMFSWLTREKTVREIYAKERFCTFIFDTAGYQTLFSLLNEVSKRTWADTVPKELPILLFAGDEDPVGGYGRGVKAVYQRLKKAGCNVMLRLYREGRHEMHNETNADEVFADLKAFLEETVQ